MEETVNYSLNQILQAGKMAPLIRVDQSKGEEWGRVFVAIPWMPLLKSQGSRHACGTGTCTISITKHIYKQLNWCHYSTDGPKQYQIIPHLSLAIILLSQHLCMQALSMFFVDGLPLFLSLKILVNHFRASNAWKERRKPFSSFHRWFSFVSCTLEYIPR